MLTEDLSQSTRKPSKSLIEVISRSVHTLQGTIQQLKRRIRKSMKREKQDGIHGIFVVVVIYSALFGFVCFAVLGLSLGYHTS